MSFDVPEACTLPTAEQPARLAEFDDLFATAVRRVDRLGPTHARLHLTGAAGLVVRVRELAARETQCCSFFTFTTTEEPAAAGEAAVLDIEVPPARADVLAALAQLAVDALARRTNAQGPLAAEPPAAGRVVAELPVAGRVVAELPAAGRVVALPPVTGRVVAELPVAGRVVAPPHAAGAPAAAADDPAGEATR